MTTSADYDRVFKILLIGDSGVGKSSLLLRFVDDDFQEDQAVTIGVDFKTRILDIRGERICLTLWDTAGQEKFRSLTSSYYRGTHGVVLVYDVTKRSSFTSLETWLHEVEMYSTNKDAILMLVGNKLDKEGTREVSKEEGARFARSHAMLFLECSAKTKIGVQQAFDELAYKILDTPSLWADKKETGTVRAGQGGDPTQAGCGGYYCSI